MKIEVIRQEFTDTSTIGEMYIDGKFFAYTLEDIDRGLTQDMPIEEVKRIKVMHKTAIPYGTYKVIVSQSMRLKRVLPLLLNVPGFEGIRIHKGNNSDASSGCILVGSSKAKNFIGNTTVKELQLVELLKDQKDITITIRKA